MAFSQQQTYKGLDHCLVIPECHVINAVCTDEDEVLCDNELYELNVIICLTSNIHTWMALYHTFGPGLENRVVRILLVVRAPRLGAQLYCYPKNMFYTIESIQMDDNGIFILSEGTFNSYELHY